MNADLVRHEPLRKEVRRAFDFWNRRYWESRLRLPIFVFHPQTPNGRRLGHFLGSAWAAGDRRTGDQDEIVFYADLCLKAGMKEVLGTLVHEMVHLWQEHYGKPSGYNHHNREWHREANRVGLQTTKGDYRGQTTPSSEFNTALKEFEPRLTGIPFRREVREKGRLRKWVCLCGYAVRVAVPLFDATCNGCGQRFRKARSTRIGLRW